MASKVTNFFATCKERFVLKRDSGTIIDSKSFYTTLALGGLGLGIVWSLVGFFILKNASSGDEKTIITSFVSAILAIGLIWETYLLFPLFRSNAHPLSDKILRPVLGLLDFVASFFAGLYFIVLLPIALVVGLIWIILRSILKLFGVKGKSDKEEITDKTNTLKISVGVLVMATALCSCGNDASDVNVRDNEYLGKTLSISASYNSELGKLQSKRKKEMDGTTSLEKKVKIRDKYEEKSEALTAKYTKIADEESKKIEGNEIPYTMADGQCYTVVGPVTVKNMWLNEVTHNGFSIDFNVRINADFTCFDKEYIVCMAGDTPIYAQLEFFLNKYINKAKVGDVVPISTGLSIKDEKDWSDFSQIKFVSREEFSSIYNELEKKQK